MVLKYEYNPVLDIDFATMSIENFDRYLIWEKNVNAYLKAGDHNWESVEALIRSQFDITSFDNKNGKAIRFLNPEDKMEFILKWL